MLFSGIIVVLIGPVFLPLLRNLRWGQSIRIDGPRTHLEKAGTPTMGGLMFLVSVTVSVLLLGRGEPVLYVLLAVMWLYGLLGLADDYLKVALRRSLGLKARYKLVAQVCIGLALGIIAVGVLGREPEVQLPWSGETIFMGWSYLIFVLLVVVGTTNAVNLTDGLDGLAAGTTFFVCLAYIFIALLSDKGSPAVFAGALAGGCLGFLLFNIHPARVFMGDTGSLALGAAVSGLAVVTGTELVLPVLGGVYVLEALSVIVQVLSFRLLGKRLLLMSPLHHHFEMLGWPEKRVVCFFWLLGFLMAAAGFWLVYRIY